MISAWRSDFGTPSAYFGFVQLSTWCGGHHAAQPELRDAQMAALALPNVGYATNADHGAACNIHPPPKQYCGARLGDSATALVYSSGKQWRSPTYKAATGTVASSIATVTVTLNDVGEQGLTADVHPYNYLSSGSACPTEITYCVWASITLSTGHTLNATVTTSRDKKGLVLSAPVSTVDDVGAATVTASSYAWGPIPMMNAYDVASGLPVLQWNEAM